MTRRLIAALLLLTVAGACGSITSGGGHGPEDGAAVWQFDDDANIAYPTCWRCGADIDRDDAFCDACEARVHIDATAIDCPECGGAGACASCAKPSPCEACLGSHACPICDGSGTWHGETCPECDGTKSCVGCASHATPEPCAHCDGSHVCSNCDGAGVIALK